MINLGKLKVKVFGKSKKDLLKDAHFLCLEISDILEDMRDDFDDIHESVQESNKLILKIQEQCNEVITIFESMQNRDKADVEIINDALVFKNCKKIMRQDRNITIED